MKVEVKNLCFSYGNTPIVKNVSFKAQEGQLVAVLGANGAGKTTLFRCLMGFLKAQQGEILLDGQKVGKIDRNAFAALAAYIPQSSEPAFNYTVFETVLMGTTGQLSPFRAPGKAQQEAVREMLRLLDMEALSERGIARISGGERQLALIARALAQKAKLLVMDEPTANLDYGNQHRVMQRIRALADNGYCVLLSTHNPEHALRYATHILALQDGKVCAFGKTEEALDSALLQSLYSIPATITDIDGIGRCIVHR